LNDADSARFFLDYLTAHPDAVGWMLWYFILDQGGSRIAIGNGGFKGEPVEGTVEIGYSIVPEFQRHGYAFEGVGALVDWAFDHDDVRRVVAETLPELDGSQALLRKLGFRRTVHASEPGLLRFERFRAEHRGIN
jgi:RimJ/RimL family protein N-acetyltransferase